MSHGAFLTRVVGEFEASYVVGFVAPERFVELKHHLVEDEGLEERFQGLDVVAFVLDFYGWNPD